MNSAVVHVGSNIDPYRNIERLKNILKKDQHLVAESAFVFTKPIGILSQPDFLNGAYLIKTALEMKDLETYLKEVEISLGRKETDEKFGPRTIDLDIVVWNGHIVHRDVHERDFVKDAVRQVLPNFKI